MRITVFKTGGNAGSGGFVSNGLVLQGPLILSGSYTEPLHAVPKQYVDNVAYNLDASNITSGVLPAGRLPAFTGDASTILGSANIILSATGVTPGSVVKPTVDVKGRVISSGVLVESDISSVGFNKITTNKPVTLDGYNITDGVRLSSDNTINGNLLLSADPFNVDHAATKQYVDSAAGQAGGISVGDIIRKPYSTTPSGFLKCNGAEVDKTIYANLYSVIGDTFATNLNNGSGRPWQQQYDINEFQKDALIGWDSSTLTSTLANFSTFVTKNRVYICGGFTTTGSAYTSTVYTSAINADGTLAGWTTGTALPAAFSHSTPILTKNRVYLVGGLVSGGYNSVVYTAPINTDGTVGTWTTGPALPSSIASSTAIIIQNKVYLIGGKNGTANVNTIYSTTINDDGTLNSWVVYGTLPIAVSMSAVAVIRNRVYVLGGSTAAGAINSVYSAAINTDGTLGSWNSEISLPAKIYGASIFVTKNRVYLISGASSTTVSSNAIYSSTINSDGSLNTWEVYGALPAATSLNGCFSTKNKLFIAGGIGNSTAYTNAVYSTNISGGLNDYSPYYGGDTGTITNLTVGSGMPWLQQYQINTTQSGDITGWTTGTAFPSNIRQAQVAVTKNRVFILSGILNGGYTTAIYSAAINSDGTIGAWSTSTNLPGNRNGGNLVITKNRINIIGGDNGSNVQSSVFTAPINADGTLGAWTTGTSMPTAKYLASSIVTKGRVYTFGGYNGSGYVNLVCHAPIDSDGNIGTWVAGSTLPNVLASCCPVIIGDRLYLIGGFNGSTLSTILSTSINNDGTIGSWVTETPLPVAIQQANAFVTKNAIYIIGTVGTTTSVQYYAPINSNGSLGTWVAGTSPTISTSNACVFATSSRLYSVGGMTAGAAVATVFSAPITGGSNDYSIYYDGTVLDNYTLSGSGKPWQQQYQINNSQSNDITGWTAGVNLPVNIGYSSAIVTKNRVYLLGGHTGVPGTSGSEFATVYTAPINTDGSLGTWSNAGNNLPTQACYTQAVVTKNRVYLLCDRKSTSTYTAAINSDGTIGTWGVGPTLPATMSYAQAFATSTRVYLVGGSSTTVTYYADINADGTLGLWNTGTSLPNELTKSQVVVTKNRVYMISGVTGSTDKDTIFTADINADGSVGTWSIDPSVLPYAISFSQAFVAKNRVYLLGGRRSSNVSDMCSAPINADGTLGSWTIGSSIFEATAAAQVIVVSGKIHMLGGRTSNSVNTATISGGLNDYTAYYNGSNFSTTNFINYLMPGSGKPWQQQYQVNTSQSVDITGWTTGTALPGVLTYSQAIATKNRVYLLGGYNGAYVSTVYTAPINADGTLGSWTTGTALPGVLGYSQAIVTNNRVYLLGGNNGNAVSTVYTAPINADGTLGSWTTSTALPTAVSNAQAIVTNNRVYLLGGVTVSTVYTAPINTDGTLGTWTSSSALPGNIGKAQVIVTKNKVYILAGASTAVYSCNINFDGSLGSWVTETPFAVSITHTQSFVTKNRAYLFGGVNTAVVYTAPINPDGTLGTWTTGTSLPGVLAYSQVVATNSHIYLLGGYTTGSATVATVYTATILDSLNDYSPYYDGTIQPVSLPVTTFKLPDYSMIDREYGEYVTSYIKF